MAKVNPRQIVESEGNFKRGVKPVPHKEPPMGKVNRDDNNKNSNNQRTDTTKDDVKGGVNPNDPTMGPNPKAPMKKGK